MCCDIQEERERIEGEGEGGKEREERRGRKGEGGRRESVEEYTLTRLSGSSQLLK